MTWGWTDAETQEVVDLWKQGLSASEISIRLGSRVTRNAIIGRIYRLGVTRDGKQDMAARKLRAERANERMQRTKPASRVMPNVPATVNRPHLSDEQSDVVTRAVLALRSGQCRFPIGDLADADFHFCGAPQRPGASYCEAHERLTRAPIEATKKANRRAEKQARRAA